ncbi:PR domain zinc finger protein 15-like isoform X2 [Anthonomus grandis grandis]|uniref:PR domain zinc finger protein 15-like isoform X2 n=1 Tax=Anthonomus grandis grandis TaxID=2921223 RepID=UPI0021653EB0|nr:PR domain zinc finger protein 15-like isoform X2 [Anthonomus grandis grandis]
MDFLENPNEHLDYPVEKPLCGICGDPHSYRECKYITISSQIKDTMVPTRARLSLPHQLEIKKLADESEVICAKCFISSGTEFGPFVAKKNLTLHPLAPFPLKVFSNKESELSECYLDTTDENECCWMMFVRSAEDIEEQNLVCYQESEDIYFSTIRDIQPGEELRMWYSPYYAFRMQKKVLTFKEVPQTEVKGHIMANNPKEDEEVEMISNIIKQQQKIIPTIIWNCKFCYKLEKNVTRFAEHLLTHYSASIRKDKICHHCQKKFQYIKEYRAHLRAAHKTLQDPRKSSAKKSITRENIDSPTVRPSDPLLIDSTKSPDVLKNSSKKASLSGRKVLGDTQLLNQRFIDTVGGPLLLQFAQDTQDSSNSCLLQPGIGSFDLGTYDSGLDNDMLQFTNLICNNLDEDNSVKEPDKSNGFVCDICLKKFQTKKSVRDHLSLHIGRFFCKTCKKRHVRKQHPERYKHLCIEQTAKKDESKLLRYRCPKCLKSLKMKNSMKRHFMSKHENEYEKLCGQLDECIVIPKNRMEVKEQKTFDEVDQYIDLQKTIENMDFNIDASIDNLIGSETIDKFLKESSDQISILLADSPKPSSNVHIISDIVLTDRITNREVDLPLRTAPGNTTILTDRITNREVGLSMPDLSDIDQEVKSFGKNRVEAVPLNDDVTVYVLNEKLN